MQVELAEPWTTDTPRRGQVSCAVPHPVRWADGLAFVDDLEVVGGHATETWLRCPRCGAWLWASTDVGGKFELWW